MSKPIDDINPWLPDTQQLIPASGGVMGKSTIPVTIKISSGKTVHVYRMVLKPHSLPR